MKHISTLLFIALLIFYSCNKSETKSINNTLYYTYPAEYWNSQSLHLGNGYMGASFFGGVDAEKISLTEGSMWTGGPFRGDWEEFGVNPKVHAYMDDIRKAIVEGNIYEADSLTANYYLGDMKRFGHFTSIGDLLMEMGEVDLSFEQYKRELDLANSLGKISYTQNNIAFQREYFCSYPDRVLAIKIRSDKAASVSFSLYMEIIQDKYEVSILENTYIVDGIINHGDDRKFQVAIRVLPHGGNALQEAEALLVSNADSVTILLTAATDYMQEYPSYLGTDPSIACRNILDAAEKKGYASLKERHIADYKSLYDRVGFNLESDPKLDKLPTNERWERMKKGEVDRGLHELAFNLGRYLIISSSRPGTLPANLQGKWNTFFTPPWTGNYQANINIQEIYWPCGPTNLIECQEAYVDWTKDLAESGRKMAQVVYGTNGWISHTIGNIYGHSAPVGGIPWGVYPLAPVWHCQHLWEQFNFTLDTAYLKETAYPIIKDAVLFWLENLVEYEGYLIATPSISAEHGAYLKKDEINAAYPENSYNRICYNIPGPSQDAQMIGDLFKMCMEAAEILKMDQVFSERVKQHYEKLMPPQIGKYGQLQEWYEDIDSPEDIHRHISHLYAVCPGNDIHPLTTPELAEAAKKSLNMRGEGRFMDIETAAGGNWSLAWRIWSWTRLMDGNRALKIFKEMLTEEGFENLTTYQHAEYGEGGKDLEMENDTMHLHFQLDATATTPGFMAEMLLQSHLDAILLLPALPDEWPNGSVSGLKARRGYTVDLEWEKGELKHATIKSSTGKVPVIYVGTERIDPDADERIEVII
ncbi:glycoside hydrolase N-terminal domain-containing protein [Bacteroidota bacterium]